MTAEDIRDLIVGYCILGEGGTSDRWRPIIGDVIVREDDGKTNWTIKPSGTPNELFSVHVALSLVRSDCPYIAT